MGIKGAWPMNKAMAKAVAFCLAAGLTFTGTVAAVYAGGEVALVGVAGRCREPEEGRVGRSD